MKLLRRVRSSRRLPRDDDLDMPPTPTLPLVMALPLPQPMKATAIDISAAAAAWRQQLEVPASTSTTCRSWSSASSTTSTPSLEWDPLRLHPTSNVDASKVSRSEVSYFSDDSDDDDDFSDSESTSSSSPSYIDDYYYHHAGLRSRPKTHHGFDFGFEATTTTPARHTMAGPVTRPRREPRVLVVPDDDAAPFFGLTAPPPRHQPPRAVSATEATETKSLTTSVSTPVMPAITRPTTPVSAALPTSAPASPVRGRTSAGDWKRRGVVFGVYAI